MPIAPPLNAMWKPELTESVETPLFRALCDAIARDVRAGRLSEGTRMPTHRALAHELGLARGTVARAYSEAERIGILESEVGRGTFVAGDRSLASSLESLTHLDPDLIDLSLNFPLYQQDPDLAPALRRLAKNPRLAELTRYQNQSGMPRHRVAGARWLKTCGLDVGSEDIVVTAGSQHAITISLSSICEPGDVVAVEELTYPGIRATAQMLHLKLIGIEMDDEGMIPESFEAACQKRRVRALFTVPTVHNPTTATLSAVRREAIARIAIQHGVAIVEDDVHRMQAPAAAPPIRTHAPAHTFYVGTVSKAFVGGLRIAYLVVPPQFLETVNQRILATSWMIPPLNAEIMAEWIEDGTVERVVASKCAEANRRQEIAREILGSERVFSQPGSTFLWLRLPSDRESAAFTVEARRKGVAVTPMETFDIGGRKKTPAIRVCIGCVDSEARLRKGLEAVRDLLHQRADSGMAIV